MEAAAVAAPKRAALEFVIRPMLATDREFIGNSWVNSLRAAGIERKESESSGFFKHHTRRVIELTAGAEVRIAAPPDDDVTILGYAVLRPPEVVHMVYVKPMFRRLGIARALLQGLAPNDVLLTEWTREVSDWIWHKHQRAMKLRYNPFYGELP